MPEPSYMMARQLHRRRSKRSGASTTSMLSKLESLLVEKYVCRSLTWLHFAGEGASVPPPDLTNRADHAEYRKCASLAGAVDPRKRHQQAVGKQRPVVSGSAALVQLSDPTTHTSSSMPAGEPEDDPEDRPHLCEECGASFKRACELGNHKRGHMREKLLSGA
jgi:hypothetical protein